MEPASKPYAVLAVLVPIAVLAFGLLRGWSWFSLLFSALILVCCFPLLCAMLCMWLHGSGYRFLNVGIDWRSMDDKKSREVASRWGLWLSIGTAVLLLGMALITTNLIIGLVLTVASVGLMLLPFAKGATKGSRLPAWPRSKRIAAVAVFTLLTIVPFAFVMDGGAGSMSNSVEVSMDEEGFTVKAPFFDHRFSYDEVDDCQYFEDFPKGKRVMGYYDGTISSGKYENDLFGRYELASYSKIRPCIAISIGGEMYAFNQNSDGSTELLYESLKERLPRCRRNQRHAWN